MLLCAERGTAVPLPLGGSGPAGLTAAGVLRGRLGVWDAQGKPLLRKRVA